MPDAAFAMRAVVSLFLLCQNFTAIMGRVLFKELGALNQTNDSWDALGEQLKAASGGSLLASELL